MTPHNARYKLNERVKELNTLYKCGQILLQRDDESVHSVLQEIVDLIPFGWQFPDGAAARICLLEAEFVSSNFSVFKSVQSAEFKVRNNVVGRVEVFYLNDYPGEDEGPFLKEERNLIEMLASMVGSFLNRRFDLEELKRVSANQRAIINNTNFLIWSVNPEYELISFNRPFETFVTAHFNTVPAVGHPLLFDPTKFNELNVTWQKRYHQALAGESYKVAGQHGDFHFEYSLNPIIEDNKIIGVSVFGEDISERIKYENEMQRVNQQLAELRLMALRATMNPHFIFNCLNSIQYYIMENDQKNAITYLSTFSKLIRSVLNNSVDHQVTLAEEIEMIKLYVRLELLRFDIPFDFVIEIEPGMDIESLQIPSMLIQPYVENAIVHGLYNKKEKGKLTISISEHKQSVFVEIRDNGIGRKQAHRLRMEKVQGHRSLGTTLSEERLRLINQQSGASVEITDLEEDGVPAGTVVKLWMKQ